MKCANKTHHPLINYEDVFRDFPIKKQSSINGFYDNYITHQMKNLYKSMTETGKIKQDNKVNKVSIVNFGQGDVSSKRSNVSKCFSLDTS